MMLKKTALIVGGGPAGASAAMCLAEYGVETVLVERDFSYVKPCAGGITSSGFHEFNLPENLIKKKIDKLAFISPKNRVIETRINGEIYITDRASLDPSLRNIAADKGALLIEAQFIGVEKRNGSIISLVRKKKDGTILQVQSDYVLAADGIGGSVGRSIGLECPSGIYTISAQVHPFSGSTCEFWLGGSHASRFYSWVFPNSSGASIGTGGENPGLLYRMLDSFIQRRFRTSLKKFQENKIIRNIKIFPIPVWKGGVFRSDNIFFLGDAAGIVKPITAEGIYHAMKSGQYAAKAIVSGNPDLYREMWEHEFLNQFTKMKELGDQVLGSDETVERWMELQCSTGQSNLAAFKKGPERKKTGAELTGYTVDGRIDGIKTRAFDNLMLIITEGCNLRCTYCYENGKTYDIQKRMSFETAKKAVDLFFSQVPVKMNRTSITFFGGEPTLEFDLIKKVVEYTYGHRTIGGYKGHNYNYVINTNGTVLTDEMYEFYAKLGKKLNLRITADGYGENHDSTRKMSDGKGSWHLLERNLGRYRVLKEKQKVNAYLITTINKTNFRDIFNNYTKLYELTGMGIGNLFVHEDQWQKEDFPIIKEQVVLLHEYCLKHGTMFPICNTQSKKLMNNEFESLCGAGTSSCTVNYAGDIFACHRANYHGFGSTFKLGHIDTGFDAEQRKLLSTINNLKSMPQKCQECPPVVREKCHICLASNQEAYGNFHTVRDEYCDMIRELHQLLLDRIKNTQQCDPTDAGAKFTQACVHTTTAHRPSAAAKRKQVKGILVFAQNSLHNPEALFAQIKRKQQTMGFDISDRLVTKVITAGKAPQMDFIREVLQREFPSATTEELSTGATLFTFNHPGDETEGKYCIVYDRSREGTNIKPSQKNTVQNRLKIIRRNDNRTESAQCFADTKQMKTDKTECLRRSLHPASYIPSSAIMKPVGHACNLRCHYCYYRRDNQSAASSGLMSPAVLNESMKQLIVAGNDSVQFIWHGGEPLLAGKDFYKEVVRMQESFPKGRFRNSMQTNGTLVDNEWADFLMEHQFGMGVSLDGPPEVHNVHRCDSHGVGGFDRTVEGIRKLQAAGNKVSSIAVVTKASLGHTDAILDCFREFDISKFSLNPIFEDDLDFSVTAEEYADFLCEVFDLYAALDDPNIKIEPIESVISPFIGKRVRRCSHSGLCAKHIVITNEGVISPCDRFNDKSFEFGNVMNGGLASAMQSEKRRSFINALQEREQSCHECKWFAHCHGSCTIGYILNPGTDGNYCRANKRVLQYIEDHFVFEVNRGERVGDSCKDKGSKTSNGCEK